MGYFPDEVNEAAGQMGGDWIKGPEFEGGLVLKTVKVEKVPSKYGALETDSIVERGILAVGETFRYLFADAEGNERKYDSKSMPFFIGMHSVEELEPGEWVKITRTGKGDQTRYTVERTVEPKPVSQSNKKPPVNAYPEEDIDTSSVPF